MTITFKPLNDAPKSELQTFSYSGLTVRAIQYKGEPWFFATDVCRAIYPHTSVASHGSSVFLKTLMEDEVMRTRFGHVLPKSELGSWGRVGPNTPVNLVSESGLYKLIMRSEKKEARAFQDWVTRDVLPAIRKTGGYLLNEEARDTAKADDRQGMPMFNKCKDLAVGVLV